jgi:hypothetical protein
MIGQEILSSFKTIVRAYAKATGDSDVKISKMLYGNAHFLERFFSGNQTISLDKLDEMLGLLRDKWPPDTPWPVVPVLMIRGPKRGKLSPKKSKAA